MRRNTREIEHLKKFNCSSTGAQIAGPICLGVERTASFEMVYPMLSPLNVVCTSLLE